MKRPAFWVLFALFSLASAATAWHYFPQAFSIVALDITMNRDAALEAARAAMAQHNLGPAGYRQAASFTLDSETQTFVELEGGGKDAFTRMLSDGLYFAYTWNVRHFKESEPNETLIRFTPDGRPYGFVERLSENAAGAALEPDDARRRAEAAATGGWRVDLQPYTLVEQAQERRPGGRRDHTFTYERASPVLNEGRYRLRLGISGDRLTEVTHFVRIPEAFTRRYQNMRSANETIGVGSVVGMMLFYIVGGIGIGLFYMLRQRWVIWRTAAMWGALIGVLQALSIANEWPLMWMDYDTALARTTFIAQQVSFLIATLVGFSAFFALSFVAAETLTRRAFGHHPQFWRVWSREAGSSTAILGRTAAGFLLVTVFFAYDVVLYLVARRAFGWWTPSEALLHPDVLATYVPWLSAIANSLQAGFWEECLFRAVPLAGAALIGDRFGHRRAFLVVAFVVQAIIFGAGHAPYPTLPSYARPVELILPSFGFGLLYLYFGLLPAIVLHFAFDVVWFALPIFIADAPGLWLQQVMVIVATFVPVWVIVWRRIQAGRFTELPAGSLNAAWTPPATAEPEERAPHIEQHTLGSRAAVTWLAIGVASLLICGIAIAASQRPTPIAVGRPEAADIARRALEARGVALQLRWQVMPIPDDGRSGAHELVATTAGNERRKTLVGTYLPAPGWRVRVATFEGDVVDRAEEWRVSISDRGEVRGIEHVLPEKRPGATLTEDAARQLAQRALAERAHLDVAAGQASEVSARPAKLEARTDWAFTFVDKTIEPLPQGEPRISVELAGDEVARVERFIHVPEDWERRGRALETRNLVLRAAAGFLFGGMLVASAIAAVIAWSRRRYTPKMFLVGAGLMLAASVANAANGWPSIVASLSTALPFQLQVLALIGLGLVGLMLTAVLVGLALGAMPRRLAGSGELPERDALRLGIAVGGFGAAIALAGAWLRVPAWADAPAVGSLGTFSPILDSVLDPLPSFLVRCAIMLTLFTGASIATEGWRRRRAQAAIVILLAGLLGSGTPIGLQLGRWLASAGLTAIALLIAYVAVLRADLTMVPVAIGTMTIVGVLGQGVRGAFPGAFAGSVLAAAAIAVVAWWWFGALRRARQGAGDVVTVPR